MSSGLLAVSAWLGHIALFYVLFRDRYLNGDPKEILVCRAYGRIVKEKG